MKSTKTILGIWAFCCLASLVSCQSLSFAKSSINTNWRGLALKGYDPVAYFTLSRPLKGLKEFEYTWREAKWRFADQHHLNLFKADPMKYAPQYGGY